jgi:hypothetical protein
MKIYMASSWKNATVVLALTRILRGCGHEVYAFCEEGQGHFVFSVLDWHGEDLRGFTARKGFDHPAFRAAFLAEKAGMDWADAVVLLLPCGRSSHLEAGYAAGQGKRLIVYGPPVLGEFDVMYGFAHAVCETTDELLAALRMDAK